MTKRSKRAPNNTSAIHAYWRNDESDGLGLQLSMCHEDFVAWLADIRDVMRVWDENTTAADATAQLSEFASRKGSLSASEAWAAIMNIAWLESRGHLQSDEYNGLLLTSAVSS